MIAMLLSKQNERVKHIKTMSVTSGLGLRLRVLQEISDRLHTIVLESQAKHKAMQSSKTCMNCLSC